MKRDKLFKKYYRSPYHDYELSETLSVLDDKGRSPDICFIYSGRNRGKSYEVAMQCLADAWYDDKKFMYVRRHESTAFEIEGYFRDKLDLIHDMTDGMADGVMVSSGELKLFATEEVNGKKKRVPIKDIGYYMPLSLQGKHKSEQFPDCYRLIIEEVLTLDPYLSLESDRVLNLISTLERNKKPGEFKTYLVSNTVTIVNPYSKAWGLNFGKTKPGEVRLTKLYLGSYDENGEERYYLIAGHYLKDKDALSKEDLAKNRNRVKTSIASNKWDEARFFLTFDINDIRNYEKLETVVFEWDDVMMQGDILEVPVNLKKVIAFGEEPSDITMPMLFIRRKTTEPLPGTRLYTNSAERFDQYTTKGFKLLYKVDVYLETITKRGWVAGADNLTMNDWDNIFKKLKLLT